MMKKTLNQFINFTLITQLMLPQYVFAQTNNDGEKPKTRKEERQEKRQEKKEDRQNKRELRKENREFKEASGDIFANIMQGTTNLANNLLNSMRQQYNQAEAQNQVRMLTNQMNPHSCPVNGVAAPCVSEIFPECNILNSRPNFVEPGVCKNGIDPNDMAASAKAGQVLGFYEHYTQMENSYKNFMLSTNNNSNLGVGCLETRADELGRKLQQREKEIDNLINKLQKTQDDFKKQAERDQAKIEDAQSLLLGDDFKGNRSSLEKNTVRFDKAFEDSACRSMLDGESFQKMGRKKGLKGIQTSVSETVNKKPQGSNGFSAAEYTPATAQAVERQLDQITRFLAGEVNREGINGINDRMSVGSAFGLNNSGAIKDVIAQERQRAEQKQKDFGVKIEGFAPGKDYDLLKSAALDPNKNIDQQIRNFERVKKNTCLQSQPNIASIIGGDITIEMPPGSDAANRFADNAYAKFVRDILKRENITIEEKMNLIAAQEGKDGNHKYIVKTKTSTTMESSTLKVNTNMTPASYVKLHIENCQAQYNNNVNDAGFSNRQVADNFKKVANEVKAFRTTLASNLVNQINDRVKNCSDSYQANATGVAVCSENSFATASPDFCLKRANSCATNMRQCLDKANQQVEKITVRRDEAVAQYKANVEKNEADLRKIYEQVEALTAIDGLNISAKLKQSLTLPTENLKFHIDADKREFVKGLGDLEIVDPNQYFDMMKTNLLSLKAEIKKQNVAVMKGTQDGDLATGSAAQSGVLGHIANIKENMQTALGEIAEFKNQCQAAFQAFMQGQRLANSEAMKRQQEQEKQKSEYCARMSSLGRTPGCESMDFFDEVAALAATQGDGESAKRLKGYDRKYKRFCTSASADENDDEVKIFQKQNKVSSVKQFCERQTPKSSSCVVYLGCYKLTKDKEGKTTVECDSSAKEEARFAVVSAHPTEVEDDDNDDEIRKKVISQLGENRSIVCGSLDNSGGVVGKTLFNSAETLTKGILETQGARND